MDKQNYDIGNRIAYFRMQKNYSVNKLANAAGISQSFLRDVELGNKNITVENLSYICDALGITLSDFFSDDFSGQITNHPVISKFYQLTDEQQAALLIFLDTIAK
jgi:transcriptional regulator with XRE-family HTH domain